MEVPVRTCSLLALAVILAACNAKGTTGDTPGDADDDQDGIAAPDDCDDADPGVFPGADEICDGVDQNCDGTVDEGVTSEWFRDEDADGYGSTETTSACEAPAGFTDNADDCEDLNHAVNPGADEICDGLDNDCDKDADSDAVDQTESYVDLDEDGYGDPTDVLVTCGVPEGRVDVALDCDDLDPFRNPDAPEWCDGLDDDCDNLVDTDDPDVQGAVTTYDDADGDTYGDSATATLVCEIADGTVTNDLDCDDANPLVNPAADEVCDAVDTDCDGAIDEDDPDVDDVGLWYPDADGDGYGTEDSVPTVGCFGPKGTAPNDDDCDDTDALVAGPDPYYRDTDQDGYGAGAISYQCDPGTDYAAVDGDCRNSDDQIYPGAPEVCDGSDNNCDGTTDEADPLVELLTFYRDDDGDGYGVDSDSYAGCDQASGYVLAGGDCGDGDTAIYPSAVEYCDGKDNDCDGTTDGDVAYVDWYADDDHDGWGDATDIMNECSEPDGYVLVAGDCDDGLDAVHPEAEDVCADDLDNDCDGSVDNCFWDLAAASSMFEGSSSNGRLGWAVAAGDLDGDGAADVVTGSPYLSSNLGEIRIAFGPSEGTVAAADMDVAITTTASSYLGYAIAVGDADGDGQDDLLATTPLTSPAVVHLFLGPVTADLSVTEADATLEGTATFTASIVTILSDMDGDDLTDIAVGAPYGGSGGTVYVVAGPLSGVSELATTATWTYVGVDLNDAAGDNVEDLGDLDGDGLSEIGVSAHNALGTGAVYVLPSGTAGGTYDIDVAAVSTLTGTDTNGLFGSSLAAGDLDGDGYGDLLVGADSADTLTNTTGAVYGFHGPLSASLSAATPDTLWEVPEGGAFLGTDLLVGGDLDGDDRPDIAMSADYGESDHGAVYITPASDLGVVDVSTSLRFVGERSEETGSALAWIPDWDDDGQDELLIGAPNATTSTGFHFGGRAYVVLSGDL
jgi:hypothetical protein